MTQGVSTRDVDGNGRKLCLIFDTAAGTVGASVGGASTGVIFTGVPRGVNASVWFCEPRQEEPPVRVIKLQRIDDAANRTASCSPGLCAAKLGSVNDGVSW